MPIGRTITAAGLLLVLLLLGWHVMVKLDGIGVRSLTGIYTVIIGTYVMSRFVLAAFYSSPTSTDHEPTVAIVVPAYNEGAAVARTIEACASVAYPVQKLEIIVVNDGSTDHTWSEMRRAASRYAHVRCIDLGRNMGKRAAMAAGIRATAADVVVFVDSDSIPASKGVRMLVQAFADPHVGAVAGLTYARNADVNSLTRMQASRYYVSFQLLKSAESVVGAVACCSGCFAAYRHSAISGDILSRWEHQRFMGRTCTYGDDRALTNMLLRQGWRTTYDNRAHAWTEVPENYTQFFRQQLRWKKSWAREGPILMSHLWRTRPLAFVFVAINTIAGMASPAVVIYNTIYVTVRHGVSPIVYVLGLYLVSVAYALLHRVLRQDGLWFYAVVGTVFYLAFSLQLYWAIVRLRDGKWGTREVAQPTPSPVIERVRPIADLVG